MGTIIIILLLIVILGGGGGYYAHGWPLWRSWIRWGAWIGFSNPPNSVARWRSRGCGDAPMISFRMSRC
jgi:hypothetical protein